MLCIFLLESQVISYTLWMALVHLSFFCPGWDRMLPTSALSSPLPASAIVLWCAWQQWPSPTLAFPSKHPLPSLPSPTCSSMRPPDICIWHLTSCIVLPQCLQRITALKGNGPPLSMVTWLQHAVAYCHMTTTWCSILSHDYNMM